MKKITLLLCLLSGTIFGQMTETEVKEMINGASEPQLVVECSRFLQENFYHFADLVTDKLLKMDAKNGNYNYRKGFILLGMNKNPETALKHLEIASAKTEVNYDIYSPNEKSAPIDVFFYLGICHHRLGNLDKALTNYNKFLEQTTNKSTLIPEAKTRIAQVASAKKLMQGGDVTVLNNSLSDINSPFDESNPIISPDGKSLIYSSARPRPDNQSATAVEPMFNVLPADVYQITANKAGVWSPSTSFDLNEAKVDERISSLSLDERTAYYSRWNDPEIYLTSFKGGQFDKAQKVGLTVNNGKEKTPPFNLQMTISADGNTAFFVSNALSGKGGWDLFMTQKQNEKWSAATNLTMLNSPSDEMAPCLSLDGKTLYFVSNNSESMGGYDVFKSTQDENGMWSKPVNLGSNVNSFSDEVGFSLTGNGQNGYVVSNRPGTKGMYDIFTCALNEVPSNVAMLDGRIVNTKGKEIPEDSYITLKCINCSNSAESVITPRMRDGGFFSSLEKCKEYELAYYYGPLTKKPYTNRFKTSCDPTFEVISKRVLILDEDKKIVPFPTYEIRGVVTDIASGKPITDAKISININTKAEDKSTNATGTYNSYLIDKYEFETHIEGAIKVDADGYLSASQNISTDLLEDSVVVVNFQLESSGKGFLGPYVINYQFDKYKLTAESKTKLEEVIKLMNDNPAVKIEIRSHTDSRGPKHYNQWLSEMRANTAAEYLKSKVSSPDRISFKGFGESELLKPCGDGVKCSDEEHYQNRRTEFIILN